MSRRQSLAERIAAIPGVPIDGTFLRHAAPNRDAFAGGPGGRWGRQFPVIYLGRPVQSCVEEAYRHLVDETGVPAHLVKPRVVYTVKVEARNILDLRSAPARARLGISATDLTSEVGDYDVCQGVAAVAHQLEYHGVIAPAATKLGETLALFRERIGASEFPEIVRQDRWHALPARPGTEQTLLTLVQDL